MSLLTKFAVLAGMLALMIMIGMGMPGWAMYAFDRDVAGAQAELVTLVETLDEIDSCVRVTQQSFKGSMLDEDQRAEIARQSTQILEALEDLNNSIIFRLLAGKGVASSLMMKIQLSAERLSVVSESESTLDDHQSLRVFLEQMSQAQALVEIVRVQLRENIDFSIVQGRHIRTTIDRILLWSILSSCLVGLLSVLFLRRWVLVPVLDLRAATKAITAGNLDYRIHARTRDEIGSLASEVNTMAETISTMQAQRIAQERIAAVEAVLRRIVHNLRNTLGGIRGLAEAQTFHAPPGSEASEDQNLMIATIDQFESWLAKLLLSTSPLNVYRSEESPRVIMDGLVHTVMPLAKSKSIQFIAQADRAPMNVLVDQQHLQQALVALVSNAIEATPRGGQVHVIAETDMPGDSWAIHVDDSGPGIEETIIGRVFEPYFTTKKDGTGLGLAMVRNVVRAHGGEIQLGTSGLGGARFSVTIPIHMHPPDRLEHGEDRDH